MGRQRWQQAIAVAGFLVGCSPARPDDASEPTSSVARTVVRGRLELTLPASPLSLARVSDPKSSVGVSFQLVGARSGKRERVAQVTRFVGAGPDGGDVWHRVTPFGIEDDTEIRSSATPRQLEYRLELEQVAGLRLVAGVLELLDVEGTPRLRVGPASVRDAKGLSAPADLEISGCEVDRDPRGPWQRPVTSPGSSKCGLSVRWKAGLSYPIVVDPPWSAPASKMVVTRDALTATVLSNGRVLATGGQHLLSNPSTLKTAELYDPATDTWSPTGDLTIGRLHHRAARLTDGRVLVVGGTGPSAELYDPLTGAFTATGSMSTFRGGFTLHRLSTGKVLAIGGTDGTSNLASCELYDPATGSFSPTGSMAATRNEHASDVLKDGSVLVMGSLGALGAERYLVASGTWQSAGSPTTPTARESSLTTLADGRAIAVGGRLGTDANPYTSIYDPVTNSWSIGPGMPGLAAPPATSDCCTAKPTPGCDMPATVASMCINQPSCCTTAWSDTCVSQMTYAGGPICGRRTQHSALLLQDGRLLIAAGRYMFAQGGGGETPLIYTPQAGGKGSWLIATGTAGERDLAPLVALPSGDALIVGGDIEGTSQVMCLSQGCACNTGVECYSGNCVDGVCCDTSCAGGCQACSAALKGQGANGACGPIKTGADPQSECAATAAESCGLDGFCDGAGACRFHPSGTKCGPSSCIDEIQENHPDTCDGAGACVENGSGPCNHGYLCVGDACLTSCLTASDCQTHYLCVNGVCKRLPNGQACTDAAGCESDLCVDGVCCNAKCDGQCEACDVEGKAGDCSPVIGAPHAGRPQCLTGPGGECDSTCNGTDPDACQHPGKEKSCGEGKTCDGKGACFQTSSICSADKTKSTAVDGTVTECGLYTCDTSTGKCGASCSASNECSENAVCDQPKCVASAGGEEESSGCGCELGARHPGSGWLLALLGVFALGRRRGSRSLVTMLVAVVAACAPSAGDESAPTATTAESDDALARIVARFPDANLTSAFEPDLLGRSPARVTIGDGFEVEDRDANVAVAVQLVGENRRRERTRHGALWLARGGGPEGSDVLLRSGANGIEDFVVFERPPARAELEYQVDVTRVAGLRFVAGVLEFLDAKGSPRLAVNSPWTLDATGVKRDATLAIEGCEVDRDPRPSFGRAVTPPNARRCRVRVGFDAGASYPLLVDPSWTLTTSPGTRTTHASAVLLDGRLLVSGGVGSTARVYSNGVFNTALSMAVSRGGHTATTLNDGRVLVTGGGSNTAEVFNPTTGTWSTVSPMAASRQYSRATKLPDGSVLITGGDTGGTAERFLPASNTFQSAGSLGAPRVRHTATALSDGRVLVAGGSTATEIGGNTAIVYTLGTGWAATGNMQALHANHVAERLADGRVLVAGGDDVPNYPGEIADAETWNPATGVWTTTNPLPSARRAAEAISFGNGEKIYVIGGRPGSLQDTGVIFDGTTNTWSDGGTLNRPRWTHTVSLLPNGVLMVVGTMPASETFPPAEYQCVDFGCACSATAPCLVGACVDGVCCKTACAGICEACSAALKKTGADGDCGPISDGDADPMCATEPASTCGTIGTCDGVGACRTHPVGTECIAASCAGPSTFQATASCDGAGTCVAPPVAACEPNYACTNAACATSCTTNDECVAPATCNANQCTKKPNGADCGTPTECASGFCVDGNCCDKACTGQCEYCASAGVEGVCSAVTGAPQGERDPCAGAGSECAGTCADDRTQCTYPTDACGAGKECSNGSCVAVAGVCVDGNTASQPVVGPKTLCAPYLCANGECLDACSTSQDCATGWVCDDKLCVLANPPAETSDDDGGCGCRTARSDTRLWTWVLAGLGLSMLLRRRRA